MLELCEMEKHEVRIMLSKTGINAMASVSGVCMVDSHLLISVPAFLWFIISAYCLYRKFAAKSWHFAINICIAKLHLNMLIQATRQSSFVWLIRENPIRKHFWPRKPKFPIFAKSEIFCYCNKKFPLLQWKFFFIVITGFFCYIGIFAFSVKYYYHKTAIKKRKTSFFRSSALCELLFIIAKFGLCILYV